MTKEELMRRAIVLSVNSVKTGGGPFGAVIAKDGEIIAEASNSVTLDNDPTAHAEVNCIRKATKKLATFDLAHMYEYNGNSRHHTQKIDVGYGGSCIHFVLMLRAPCTRFILLHMLSLIVLPLNSSCQQSSYQSSPSEEFWEQDCMA